MSCDTRTEHLRNLWGLATSLLIVQTEVQHLSNSAMSAQWVYISEILYHSILSVKQNQLKSVSELGIIRIKYTLKLKSIYNSHRMKSSLNLCVILPFLGSLKPCESFRFVIILFRLIFKFVLFLSSRCYSDNKKKTRTVTSTPGISHLCQTRKNPQSSCTWMQRYLQPHSLGWTTNCPIQTTALPYSQQEESRKMTKLYLSMKVTWGVLWSIGKTMKLCAWFKKQQQKQNTIQKNQPTRKQKICSYWNDYV